MVKETKQGKAVQRRVSLFVFDLQQLSGLPLSELIALFHLTAPVVATAPIVVPAASVVVAADR